MRILDEKRNQAAERVSLFLTRAEAAEMRDMLEALLNDETNHHVHISDAEFEREVTIAVYDENDLSLFHDRAKKLILTGE